MNLDNNNTTVVAEEEDKSKGGNPNIYFFYKDGTGRREYKTHATLKVMLQHHQITGTIMSRSLVETELRLKYQDTELRLNRNTYQKARALLIDSCDIKDKKGKKGRPKRPKGEQQEQQPSTPTTTPTTTPTPTVVGVVAVIKLSRQLLNLMGGDLQATIELLKALDS